MEDSPESLPQANAEYYDLISKLIEAAAGSTGRLDVVTDLLRVSASLDVPQLKLLREMINALHTPCSEWVNADSDLMGDGFASSMLNRLRLHHATSEEKFKKTSFEFAFIAASRVAGRTAVKTQAHTHQGADVVVDGTRWSLKTEAAANISESHITISKLSEARWIRECADGNDFARESMTRISRHLEEYDRVATLRAFSIGDHAVRYDLVEIPWSVLQDIGNLTPSDFSDRTKNGSSSARVRSRSGKPSFTLVLDGSVEKITLRNIPVSSCVIHAQWTVPIMPQAPAG